MVSITSPTATDTFTAPVTITVQAAASDGDGSVVRVEFYNGSTFLDADTVAPYSAVFAAPTRGTHTLTAVAVDDRGGSTTSTVVTITVGAGQPTFYFVESDHLGTPRVLSSVTGADVWSWDFAEPFGDTPPDDDVDGDGLSLEFNPRFPGQYFDAETGLHQNWFRDYDPRSGGYLQSDPLGLVGGMATYAYASDNPTRHVDPLGLLLDINLFSAGEMLPTAQGTPSGWTMDRWADMVTDDPNVITMGAHGAQDRIMSDKHGRYLTPKEIADLIRGTPKWERGVRVVRVLSCNTGSGPRGGEPGLNIAQDIANELGGDVIVEAPDTRVYFYGNYVRYHEAGMRWLPGSLVRHRPKPPVRCTKCSQRK